MKQTSPWCDVCNPWQAVDFRARDFSLRPQKPWTLINAAVPHLAPAAGLDAAEGHALARAAAHDLEARPKVLLPGSLAVAGDDVGAEAVHGQLLLQTGVQVLQRLLHADDSPNSFTALPIRSDFFCTTLP